MGSNGVERTEKVIHSTKVTAANVPDSQTVSSLPHGAATRIWGHTAYQGRTEAIRAAAPAAQDMTHRRRTRGHPLLAEERAKNATKSRVRARGEHPLLIIKRVFGFTPSPLSGHGEERYAL